MLQGVHHIAIIVSNLDQSLFFYQNILGFEVIRKVYREERKSWKVDLSLNGNYVLELFTFPESPLRPSRPEALGLRHIAFAVSNVEAWKEHLKQKGITCEPIRTDEHTGKIFTFASDPDGLPIEFYQN